MQDEKKTVFPMQIETKYNLIILSSGEQQRKKEKKKETKSRHSDLSETHIVKSQHNTNEIKRRIMLVFTIRLCTRKLKYVFMCVRLGNDHRNTKVNVIYLLIRARKKNVRTHDLILVKARARAREREKERREKEKEKHGENRFINLANMLFY